MSTKDTNPKDALGAKKAPLSHVPTSFIAATSIALYNGALKYGRGNWVDAGVRSSVYVDAALRHLLAWKDGEEVDPDDGVCNLAAAAACLSILIDSRNTGNLNDDRGPASQPRKALTAAAGEVVRLQAARTAPEPEPEPTPTSDPFGASGWIPHRPGTKMPMAIPPAAIVEVLYSDGSISKPGSAKFWDWDNSFIPSKIIGWRYAYD